MTLFGENYNSAEFMLGLITRAEHCAGGGRTLQILNLYRKGEGSALLTRALENFVAKLLRGGSIGLNLWGLPTYYTHSTQG